MRKVAPGESKSVSLIMNNDGGDGAELNRVSDSLHLQRLCEEVDLVAHDLRNPIGVIFSNARFLELNAPGDAERTDALTAITGAARQALRITSQLDLARLKSKRVIGRRTTTRLLMVLRAIVEGRRMAARQRDITITLGAVRDRTVEIDVDLLARVLDNILDNAFRHTPDRGRIELNAAEFGDRIRIAVGNTGPAIPASHRERIFTKHDRDELAAHEINLGFGLYFCRKAITAHGGTIHIESTPDLPALFVIELPAAARPAPGEGVVE